MRRYITNHWTSDIWSCHTTDTCAHGCCAKTNVSQLGWKEFRTVKINCNESRRGSRFSQKSQCCYVIVQSYRDKGIRLIGFPILRRCRDLIVFLKVDFQLSYCWDSWPTSFQYERNRGQACHTSNYQGTAIGASPSNKSQFTCQYG